MKLKEITSHLAEHYYHRNKQMGEPDNEKRDWIQAEADINNVLEGRANIDILAETLSREDYDYIEDIVGIYHDFKNMAHRIKECKGCGLTCLCDDLFNRVQVLINQ